MRGLVNLSLGSALNRANRYLKKRHSNPFTINGFKTHTFPKLGPLLDSSKFELARTTYDGTEERCRAKAPPLQGQDSSW